MTGPEVYNLWTAMKLHFTTEQYDYIKYNGKVKPIKEQHFLVNKCRYFCQKLSSEPKGQLENLMVSNFVYNDNLKWIGDLDENILLDWQKKMDGITYQFRQECKEIKEYLDENHLNWNDLHKPKENTFPLIVQMVLQNDINLETFLIFDSFFHFIGKYDKIYSDNPIWKEFKFKALKYEKFLPWLHNGKAKEEKYKIAKEIFCPN